LLEEVRLDLREARLRVGDGAAALAPGADGARVADAPRLAVRREVARVAQAILDGDRARDARCELLGQLKQFSAPWSGMYCEALQKEHWIASAANWLRYLPSMHGTHDAWALTDWDEPTGHGRHSALAVSLA